MTEIEIVITEDVINIDLGETTLISISDLSDVSLDYICGETINSNRVVVLQNGKIYKADNTNMNHLGCVVGIAKQAGVLNDTIKVMKLGTMTNSSWDLLINKLCYFNNIGEIIQTVSTTGFLQSVGIAKSATSIDVSISDITIN